MNKKEEREMKIYTNMEFRDKLQANSVPKDLSPLLDLPNNFFSAFRATYARNFLQHSIDSLIAQTKFPAVGSV